MPLATEHDIDLICPWCNSSPSDYPYFPGYHDFLLWRQERQFFSSRKLVVIKNTEKIRRHNWNVVSKAEKWDIQNLLFITLCHASPEISELWTEVVPISHHPISLSSTFIEIPHSASPISSCMKSRHNSLTTPHNTPLHSAPHATSMCPSLVLYLVHVIREWIFSYCRPYRRCYIFMSSTVAFWREFRSR